MCQQKSGEWKITTVSLEHTGHIISAESYGPYSHIKKLHEDDLAFADGGAHKCKTCAKFIHPCCGLWSW